MTLGLWLRDYLYTPLFRFFSRKENSSLHVADILALFFTWIFVGIWHGAAWHYIVYGLVYFVFIAAERIIEYQGKKRRKRLKIKKKPKTVGQIIALHVYCILVVLLLTMMFRADSLLAYVNYIKSMFWAPFSSELSLFILQDVWLIFIVAAYFSFPIVSVVNKIILKIKSKVVINIIDNSVVAGYAILFVVDVSAMINSSYNPFLYFNF